VLHHESVNNILEIPMTILSGIFSRHKDHPVSEAVCEELKLIISRHPKDEVLSFKDNSQKVSSGGLN
jgi:hypothetical protein